MSELELINVGYTYQKGMPDEKKAVTEVSFKVEKGDSIGIIGHTGSGKSTLIQMLNGLLKPTEGKVMLDGHDFWENKENIRQNRFKVGLVLQYPEYQLFEETVRKDIAFGPSNMGLNEKEIDSRVEEAAGYMGITSLLERSPFDLSGGEKRRAAIAGVLAMRPEILILDEPTAGLDPKGRKDIMSVISAYHKDRGNTVMMVSHSMDDVAAMCNKVLVMNEGHMYCFKETSEVFKDAENLRNLGLNIPSVTDMLLTLKDNGLAVDTDCYTVKDGAQAIVSAVRKVKS